MSLVTFKEQFDNAYQAVFDKVLVAMEIANTRLEQQLTYGASVKRVKYALAPIRVRNITIGQNRTIDQLNDSGETLQVNKNKGSDFRISRKEMVQAGPLNPAESIGSEVAKKLSRYIDADVFAEVKNALQTFDAGDLTTMASSGTPITLSTTNVPQLLAQGRAKLRRGNQDLTSLALVLDSYGGSVIEQYVMSKNIDLAGAAFQNGYAGPVGGAELDLSENLLAEAIITIASNPTNGQTFSVNGFVYTFVSSLGSTPGNVLIDTGTGVDVTRDNLIDALLQDAATAGVKYVAWTDADPNYDQSNWVDLQIAAVDNDTTDQITFTGTGSGRLAFGGTATFTIASNLVHAYYGKKGAIDVVIQDLAEMEMVDDPYQRAKIVRADAIYGIKTFADGRPQFLDVHLQS